MGGDLLGKGFQGLDNEWNVVVLATDIFNLMQSVRNTKIDFPVRMRIIEACQTATT